MEPRSPEAEEPPGRPEAPAEVPVVAPSDAPLPDLAAQEPPPAVTPAVFWGDPGVPQKRRVPGVPGLIFAGVIPRSVAWFVDLFLIAVVSLVVLTALIAIIVGGPRQNDTALSVIAWIGIAVIAAVYFISFWTGTRRATPGMRLLKLQVGFVATGQPLTARQAVLRVAALGIPIWPLIAIPAISVVSAVALTAWPILLLVSTAVSARRRGLHDRVAWSAVVMPSGRSRTA
jgi:uncharacterized RDD family membrane protein YckC